MKKFKRILSVLLVAVMVLSLFSGCSKKKQTMFTAIEDAASFTTYSYKVDASFKSSYEGLGSGKLSLYGDVDGNDLTMSVKASYSFFSLEAKDFIVIKDNNMYISLADILDTVLPLVVGSGATVAQMEEEYGIKISAFELPLDKSLFPSEDDKTAAVKLCSSMLEEALADCEIEGKKGEYSVSVGSMKEIAKLVDNTLTTIYDHKSEIVDLSKKNTEKSIDAVKKLADIYIGEFVAAAEEYAKTSSLISEDEVALIKNEYKGYLDEAMEELDLDEMYDEIDEAFDTIKEYKKEIVDEIKNTEDVTVKFDFNNSLTGKKGKRVYTTEAVIKVEVEGETLTINLSGEMTETKDVEIKKPAEYTTLKQLVLAFLKYAEESGELDDYLGVVEPTTEYSYIEPTTAYVEPTTAYVEPTTEEPTTLAADKYYDGELNVTCGYEGGYVDIVYNTDVVACEKEYCDPEYGQLCFQFVNDEYTYLFMSFYNYDMDELIEDEYENVKGLYAFVDMEDVQTFQTISGLDVNFVTIHYGEQSVDERSETLVFYVLNNGCFYGSFTDYDGDLDTMVELLANSFVKVGDCTVASENYEPLTDEWVDNVTENEKYIAYEGVVVTVQMLANTMYEFPLYVDTMEWHMDLENSSVVAGDLYLSTDNFADCVELMATNEYTASSLYDEYTAIYDQYGATLTELAKTDASNGVTVLSTSLLFNDSVYGYIYMVELSDVTVCALVDSTVFDTEAAGIDAIGAFFAR